MEKKLDEWSARLDRLEKLAKETPEDRAARLGAESAAGSEEELEAANRRHRQELQDPTFAKSYFAAQRVARAKIKSFHSMVPTRRLA
jgi:hypothetical protein